MQYQFIEQVDAKEHDAFVSKHKLCNLLQSSSWGLVKENWNDKNDMEYDNGIHRSDTVEEKISLFNRFGLAINYGKPSSVEFYDIVLGLAKKNKIKMHKDKIIAEANIWELKHGGISGRSAQQFINYLLSKDSED